MNWARFVLGTLIVAAPGADNQLVFSIIAAIVGPAAYTEDPVAKL